MKFKLFEYAKLKRDYINGTDYESENDDAFKKGWIGTIIELYENQNYAIVEFDEHKYNIKNGILSISLDDLEPCD